MDERDVLARIRTLMDEEQQLRARHSDTGHPADRSERERLQMLEEQLDQCWDLLRQRRARREFGLDPEEAEARDTDTVERYLQ